MVDKVQSSFSGRCGGYNSVCVCVRARARAIWAGAHLLEKVQSSCSGRCGEPSPSWLTVSRHCAPHDRHLPPDNTQYKLL